MDTVNNQDFSYLDNQNLALIPGFNDKLNNTFTPYPEMVDIDVTPQTKTLVGDVRNRANLDLFSGNGFSTLDNIIRQTTGKPSLSGGFANIYETHDRLSDGSFIPKYNNYLQGTNNDARLSANQSSLERFFNPVIRGTTKVARGIPLDIASFVYGVSDAVVKGRFDSLYDNNFANWVDDLDKRTDNAYANYYNENQSSLLNPTYLWDKTLGGAEFTARMIGSEALIAYASGGTSVGATISKYGIKGLAKAGRIAEAVETATNVARNTEKALTVADVGRKNSGVLKNLLSPIKSSSVKGETFITSANQADNLMNNVNKAYKFKDYLKTARFTATGSAYEAGFEARHFENEAEQAFWTYHRNNGTTPTQDEINGFYDKLEGQSNKVFMANIGLLTVSNLAMFGNMLNIKTPFGKTFGNINEKIGAKLFGQGVEEIGEKGVATAIKATVGQKALAYTTPVIKGILTEGVFEEGGQGIASNMMKNYVASAYDPQAMKETANYTDAFTKAFGDQFGTKEGLEEIAIGGIIGGLFGGIGGISETSNAYKKQNIKADVQTFINQNKELLYTDSNLASIFASTSRNASLQQQLDKAISENKITESSLKQAENFVSMLESAYSVGKEGDMIDILLGNLQGADNKLISERLGIDINQVEDFKQAQIEGVNSIVDTYKTSRQFAENIFRGSIKGEDSSSRANMISGLSYAMTMGKVAEMTASNLFSNVRTSIENHFGTGELSDNLNTIEVLAYTSEANKQQLSNLEKEITTKTEEAKNKALELSQISNNPNATDSEKSNNVNSQAKLQSELKSLNDNISDLRNEVDLLKSSIISNFYSVKQTSYVNKENLTDFQTKVDALNNAIANISNKSNVHEIVKNMEEFNRANAYYKQFNDIANSLTDPKLQYSTYNHLFSQKRTKNKNLNDYTLDFLNKVGNVSRGYNSNYTGSLQNEIELFDGTVRPSKALKNYIQNKQDKLTEKEQEIKDYLDNAENIFNTILERKKLTDRLQELQSKMLSENVYNAESIITIENEINLIKEELKTELDIVNSLIKSSNSKDEIYELSLRKNRLNQEALSDIEFLEKTKENFPLTNPLDGLTKEEQAELNSIITELGDEPMGIEEYEAQNDIYKNEIYMIVGESKINPSISNLDEFYISDPTSTITLNENQETRIAELVEKIRENNLMIQSLKAPKFSNSDSLENQIQTFIDANPIFSNEGSPYYSSGIDDVTMTQDEMNEYEVLKNNSDKTEEENERFDELSNKAEKVIIMDNLEFGGGTLKDLLDLKSQAETLTENSNETSIEVNERIFNESIQPIKKDEGIAYSSAYVTLIYDSAVVSNAIVEGEEVERIHNVRTENLLGRFFDLNPDATLQVEDLSGDSISTITVDNYNEEGSNIDNLAGISIVFPNGERLIKPERSKAVTGVAFGYTGNLNDFGLQRERVSGQTSKYDLLYERNSQGGLSQVKSDFQVTVGGVSLDFNPDVINKMKPGDKVDLVYLPEADYSIEVGQKLEDVVIVVQYKGENIGVLKASNKPEGEWDTLKKKRESVVYHKKISGVEISEKYLGLPNIEYDSNNQIVTHDASSLKELGYLKPDGEYVYLYGGKKSNVNTRYIDAVVKDGTITPFAVITYHNEKFAFPIIVESESTNKVNLLEDILSEDINDSKKVYNINKMLNENGLYTNENKVNLENFNNSEKLDNLRSLLENSEKLVNILDHEAYLKANKRIMLDVNNPFNSSKFKLNFDGIKEKPKNSTNKGGVNSKTATVGKNNANNNKCK